MVTFAALRAHRPARQDDGTTRLPIANLRGLALARSNGRTCRECEVPLKRGNPYRKGSRNHEAFIEGWNWADARARQIGEAGK